MGFSWYWKTNHEIYHQIFLVFMSWDFNGNVKFKAHENPISE